MGRKVHPIGFRLNINQPWQGRWYAEGKQYVEQLHQDFQIRKVVHSEAEKAGVSLIEVERFPGKVKISVHTAKPGILIGRKGESVKKMRTALETLTGKKIDLEIKEIKNPDTDAFLVATNIAATNGTSCFLSTCYETCPSTSYATGRAGIKVQVAGRVSGAEMARTVWLREGRVPLQTCAQTLTLQKLKP